MIVFVLCFLLLLSPVLADSPRSRMLDLAREEWEFFGRQTIGTDGQVKNPGHLEHEEGYWQRVGTYWKEGTDLSWTGQDRDVPWSAAFISYVMRRAGVPNFRFSEWHATYIRDSILARRQGREDAPFWGYRLDERAPQVGDLVGYAREGGISFDHQPTVYKSHTDIVVDVRPGEVDVIGGNVQDSVTLKTLRTDSEGFLVDENQRWFVVMAPRF